MHWAVMTKVKPSQYIAESNNNYTEFQIIQLKNYSNLGRQELVVRQNYMKSSFLPKYEGKIKLFWPKICVNQISRYAGMLLHHQMDSENLWPVRAKILRQCSITKAMTWLNIAHPYSPHQGVAPLMCVINMIRISGQSSQYNDTSSCTSLYQDLADWMLDCSRK